jgi:hypothetical protein
MRVVRERERETETYLQANGHLPVPGVVEKLVHVAVVGIKPDVVGALPLADDRRL